MEEMPYKSMPIYDGKTCLMMTTAPTKKRKRSSEDIVSAPPFKALKAKIDDHQVTLQSADRDKMYSHPPNTVLKTSLSSNGYSTDEVEENASKQGPFLCDVCRRSADKISIVLIHMQLSHKQYMEGYEAMKEKFELLIKQGA